MTTELRTTLDDTARLTEGFLPTDDIPPVRSSRDSQDASYARLAL